MAYEKVHKAQVKWDAIGIAIWIMALLSAISSTYPCRANSELGPSTLVKIAVLLAFSGGYLFRKGSERE